MACSRKPVSQGGRGPGGPGQVPVFAAQVVRRGHRGPVLWSWCQTWVPAAVAVTPKSVHSGRPRSSYSSPAASSARTSGVGACLSRVVTAASVVRVRDLRPRAVRSLQVGGGARLGGAHRAGRAARQVQLREQDQRVVVVGQQGRGDRGAARGYEPAGRAGRPPDGATGRRHPPCREGAGPGEEASHQRRARGPCPWLGARTLEQDVPSAAQPSGEAGQQPPARPDVVHPHGGDVVGLVADEHAVERGAFSRERDGHATVTRA